MSAYPAWTPASRPGIVPLHPLGFGLLLGRSFAALRHNPRVLLGFALAVQGVAYVLTVGITGAVGVALYARADNVPPGSDAYAELMAGTFGITLLVGLVLSLLLSAFSALVQGIVVVDVARGVLAERPTLRELWAHVRPAAWRLIGYAALLMALVIVVLAMIAVIVIAVGTANWAIGIIVTVLALVASLPLWLWLSTKLVMAPAALLLENTTIRGAIARSWRLTRGRFWPILGVVVVIGASFWLIAQVVSVPFSLLAGLTNTVVAPTGGDSQGLVVQLISAGVVEIIVLLIHVVGSIVQATASSLFYVDCRMRHEGLDLDLLAYVERRDAGETGLVDPFTVGIGRAAAPRQPMPQPYPPQAYPPQPSPPQWTPPPPAAWGPPPQMPPTGPSDAPVPPPMAPPR